MPYRTPLHDWHEAHGGRMVEYAGWRLPVSYDPGIIAEHLACRKNGALFDISHMGRFAFSGFRGLEILTRTLTNNAALLQPGFSQYTLFSDEWGRPRDDALLYRFQPDETLLVVNAANRDSDWEVLSRRAAPEKAIRDASGELGMVAVQGSRSAALLAAVGVEGLPPAERGRTALARWRSVKLLASRTGYTGEPLGFEIMLPSEELPVFWEALVRAGEPMGVLPAGLGARDTLRLEAGLPLFGHELRPDRPILSLPPAQRAVSIDPGRKDFTGRQALAIQTAELASGVVKTIPRVIAPVVALEKGMIREGSIVHFEGRRAGELTSGTMVPAWKFEGTAPGKEHFTRAIALAYVDRERVPGDRVTIEYRGREVQGMIVNRFMKREGDYLRALPFPG